jgi:hypothetical protein
VIRPPVRHPLPGAITIVSILMCVAAASAGLHGIVRPGASDLSSLANPVAERPLGGSMVGVAGVSAATWYKQTGIRASLSVSYISMSTPVAPQLLRWVEKDADGARPVIEILPGTRTLASVAAGGADGWLRSLAKEIRERVVVAFAPEANGTWYAWAGHPAEFRAAWRHVWAVLGTHDITWMWQMSSHDAITAYWPGARYVQWVGIDGYFWNPANTFRSLFSRTLTAVSGLTADPVLLSETAVGPGTGAKTADITKLFAAAVARHLLAVVWFDVAQNDPPHHQDWRLKPGSAAMAAFQGAARAYLSSEGHQPMPATQGRAIKGTASA